MDLLVVSASLPFSISLFLFLASTHYQLVSFVCPVFVRFCSLNFFFAAFPHPNGSAETVRSVNESISVTIRKNTFVRIGNCLKKVTECVLCLIVCTSLRQLCNSKRTSIRIVCFLLSYLIYTYFFYTNSDINLLEKHGNVSNYENKIKCSSI